jgi:hypothetical protein
MAFIFLSIGIIGFGLLMHKFYHKGAFDNSISKPIIFIGVLLFVCALYGKIKIARTTNIFDLTTKQVDFLEVIDGYDYRHSEKAILLEKFKLNKVIIDKEKIDLLLNEIKESKRIVDTNQKEEWYIIIEVKLKNSEILYIVLTKNEFGFTVNQLYKIFFIPVETSIFQVPDSIDVYLK